MLLDQGVPPGESTEISRARNQCFDLVMLFCRSDQGQGWRLFMVHGGFGLCCSARVILECDFP
jgi:hypothetical protein